MLVSAAAELAMRKLNTQRIEVASMLHPDFGRDWQDKGACATVQRRLQVPTLIYLY